MTVALISCGASKQAQPSPACALYTSTLFRSAYKYAQKIAPGRAWILSALHGLVEPQRILDPYNFRLPKAPAAGRRWALRVVRDLQRAGLPPRERVVLLAGADYADPLRSVLAELSPSCEIVEPLRGKGLGLRIQWLQHQMKGETR